MFTKHDIEEYFLAEKQESLFFIMIGLAAFIAGIVFLAVLHSQFYKGASFPLLAIGLLLASVGFFVYNRSDNDRIRNVYAYDMNPQELKIKEGPRMQTVLRNFVIYRYIEIVLLLLGLALYFYYIRDIRHDFWRGFGLALALMAVIALIADGFAERRGRLYTQGIKTYLQGK